MDWCVPTPPTEGRTVLNQGNQRLSQQDRSHGQFSPIQGQTVFASVDGQDGGGSSSLLPRGACGPSVSHLSAGVRQNQDVKKNCRIPSQKKFKPVKLASARFLHVCLSLDGEVLPHLTCGSTPSARAPPPAFTFIRSRI